MTKRILWGGGGSLSVSIHAIIVWCLWKGGFSELLVQHKTPERLLTEAAEEENGPLSPWPTLQNIKRIKSPSVSVSLWP